MSAPNIKITSLPTRYEPLTYAFGEKAKMTFIPPEEDADKIKRFFASAESSGQGKILFLNAASGTGKSTFVHSLEIYYPDKVGRVVRLPPPHELAVSAIPEFLAQIEAEYKFTVVNFDGREAPYFNEPEYQTFLGALNSLLRTRRDLLVIWPVTDAAFSAKLISLLEKIGGKSAFGIDPEYTLAGVAPARYSQVLEKILQVANWRLEDAAISTTEVDTLIGQASNLGGFLDSLQSLITKRFNVDEFGVKFPTLVIIISSSEPKFREIARSLRRADSYYIEDSRLLMYTKQSNVAEWWGNRATDLRSALPHVVALFNAQLVCVSASGVVHSILQSGDNELISLVEGVRSDKGNARRVMQSSELFKYLSGEALDNREYGSSVKDETTNSFDQIQKQSEKRHKAINKAILDLALQTGVSLPELDYETCLVAGLQTDATYNDPNKSITALEFHHKAPTETTNNKIAIYILEKLKEYAINYGLAPR